MKKQKRIDQIVLAYEQHVCAEALRDKVSVEDCNASTWPPLDRETLSEIVRDMTVSAIFGSIRLGDLLCEATLSLAGRSRHLTFATQKELPDIWQAKLQGGSPTHASPNFRPWIVEAMVLLLIFCAKTGIDEMYLFKI